MKLISMSSAGRGERRRKRRRQQKKLRKQEPSSAQKAARGEARKAAREGRRQEKREEEGERSSEECEGEYDELQCFACGGRFCANCIDADMDDESQVCERCVSNGVGDGCRVFICVSCDPADCQVCQHGEIMYVFC